MNRFINCCFALFIVLLLVGIPSGVLSHPFQKSADISKPCVDGDGIVNKWALIIGVGFNPHQYIFCRRDTQGLQRLLLKNGWEEDHICVLLEEQATRAAIVEAFQWLYDSDMDEDDVFFYYSGTHGYCLEDRAPFDEPDGVDEYIQPFDYDWETDDNCITDDELAVAFAQLPSKNMAIFIESCHSGGMLDGTADLCTSGRVVVTGCDVEELGSPMTLRLHWLFCYYLTKGLRGRGDTNQDSWVSAEEAFLYTAPRVFLRATIANGLRYRIYMPQHPQLYDGWPTETNNTEELRLICLS